MIDIVARLREAERLAGGDRRGKWVGLVGEAADEIDRLRGELAEARREPA